MSRGTIVVGLVGSLIVAVYLGGYLLVRALNYRELPRKPTFDSPAFYPATVIDGKTTIMKGVYYLFYPLGRCEWHLTERLYERYDSHE